MAIFYFRLHRRQLECLAASPFQVSSELVYARHSCQEKQPCLFPPSPHTSLLPSCAFLPIPMLLSALCWQAFVIQHTEKRREFKSSIFFTKSLSPTEDNCVTTALLTAPEILANPNNLSHVPFPPQATSWDPMPAENCPLCFPFLVSVSLILIIYTWLLVCMVLLHQIDISLWELLHAPAASVNGIPVAPSVLYDLCFISKLTCKLPFSYSHVYLSFLFFIHSLLHQRAFLLQ